MTGSHSRRKGASAEREVAALLGYCRNARNGLEDCDLSTPADCAYSFEVKRRARGFTPLYAALEQAQGYNGERTPVALVRDDRKGWLAVFRLEDVAWLIRAKAKEEGE